MAYGDVDFRCGSVLPALAILPSWAASGSSWTWGTAYKDGSRAFACWSQTLLRLCAMVVGLGDSLCTKTLLHKERFFFWDSVEINLQYV